MRTKSLILELENTVTENTDLNNEFHSRLGATEEISEPEKKYLDWGRLGGSVC